MPIFERSIRIEVPVTEAFEWHKREGAFERLQPPWEKVVVISRSGGIQDGAIVALGLPFGLKWVLQHCSYKEGVQFKDIQLNGPFKLWEHVHQFEPLSNHECLLKDTITYELPLGLNGILNSFMQKKLNQLFAYRHSVTKSDLEAHKGVGKMKILIAGATGLVGSALVPFLTTGGHEVSILSRKESSEGIYWNPEKNILPKEKLENFDVIINLAGENIAGRWTEKKKQKIKDSRIQSTGFLAKAMAELQNPPKTFINASAIGYYGINAKGSVNENSPNGDGFLAEVCKEWEAAALPAQQAGIRTVFTRFGIILSARGGALATMLIPFKLGLGGRVGSGKQWMSWIAIDDVIHAIYHVMINPDLKGAVNFTTPNPVQNEEYTKTLGKVLQRPTLFPLPAFIAKFLLGEMAEELLLVSVKAEPERLQKSNYSFLFPKLKDALTHLLKGSDG